MAYVWNAGAHRTLSMVRLLQPQRSEIRDLYQSPVFRGYPLEPEAIPSRIIVDQNLRSAGTTALAYRWSLPFLILLEAENRIVGSIGGKGLFDGEEEVELGYNVAQPFRRRGIATRAISGMCALAREDELGLLAHIERDNEGSRRALMNNRFVLDGIVYLPDSLALERWTWSAD